MFLDSLKELTGAAKSTPLEKAQTSLQGLAQQGVRIPDSISAPIISVQRAGGLNSVGPELEQQFWSALEKINSRIKPVEATKRYYRRSFYVVLTALLVLQLYHSSATSILGSLKPSSVNTEQAAYTRLSGETDADKKSARQTYIHFSQYLVPFPKLMGFGATPAPTAQNSDTIPDRDDLIAQIQLDLAVSFVGKFLLPLLYGMLGGVAFVLRRLSDDSQSEAVVRDPRNRYSLRVPIGALSGLAAGWILQPEAGNTVVALTPFALAFVAGYSAELVFAAMDRIVAAFTTKQPDPVQPQVTGTATELRDSPGGGSPEQLPAAAGLGRIPSNLDSLTSRALANQ